MNLLLELIPLLIFFASYKLSNLIIAAIIFSLSTIVANLISYLAYKKISYINLFGAVVVSFFAIISYFTGNPIFIKLKPTVINVILSVILMIGVINRKYYIKHLLPSGAQLDEQLLRSISYRFSGFFISLALINELIWRNFSEQIWVNFKVFGILGLTFGFLIVNFKVFKKLTD
ncbi:inner membrane-spanning protein YciB [Rickettsiales endosymbiont of Stachyamoeba lipophora]|uniref:inner membrane-spanning protein YciB n=1 Tax=Rickettsiales endosymbiont of Stachyamoeba lipophora TaxID=2486578 RepID=UPI000F64C94B|nr:septation protein IspZ [Rickettsiales endosymbiont of Stachyamoeba lipophora]AZL15627.1 intracellular septation protein A [Rickettsiales endosymbiont of Stachyamoeba lipophora]